jgi:hypothetical protein
MVSVVLPRHDDGHHLPIYPFEAVTNGENLDVIRNNTIARHEV